MLRPFFALLLLLLLLCARPAAALETAPVIGSHDTATLITDSDSVRPGHPLHVALRLRLAPGWHTYWRNPGDAGAPPDVTLTLRPAAARAGDIEWPAPERLPDGPLMSYGYTGDVVLPLTVTVPATAAPGPLSIQAQAEWLVCAAICIPRQGIFRLTVPPGDGAPSAEAPLFARAVARLPAASPFVASISPDARLFLRGPGLSPANVSRAWFFPDTPGVIDQDAPQRLAVRYGVVSLALHPGPNFHAAAPLAGVLTLVDGHGTPSHLTVLARPGAAPADPAALPLLRMLGFAFLGGLILNLMPCVFPVLAMKAMAIARLSGAERREIRLHALSYTGGVLLTFGVIGGMLLALRQAGIAAGWGFQFQSPAFVAAMAWLLFAVGLNLSGVFSFGSGVAGFGQSLAVRPGHAGSFFTGTLAVLVATPCTAPFMAAALAAALAAPAGVTVAGFLAMGAGLAAPSALLAAAPTLARALPRPGVWMEVLRQALAFPMYGACVWLLWVVSQEAGPTGVLAAASGLLLIGFGAWALGLAGRSSGRGRRLARAAGLAAALAAAAVLPGIPTLSAGAGASTAGGGGLLPGAEPFTTARLASLRAAQRPVFVDITAAWCITCLVNERVALATRQVRDAFAAHRVTLLRGDWTRQDPDVTEFLHRHDRDGVPLYVYFPPDGPPRTLPQILTATMVLHALGSAGG